MSGLKNIENILVLGSGPINIGQACEFDYSGTQACQALKEDGKRVILLNSNPATIMTDPSMADRTYIESLDPLTVIKLLNSEKIDAILPTMGGQTSLNLIMALSKIPGALDGVEIIGANLKSIYLAEDRRAFRDLIESMGFDTPRSAVIRNIEEIKNFANETGYPFILRPSYTLGGTGQSFVYSETELEEKGRSAIQESPIGEVLVEESVLGWKEYELEVVRDHLDNAIVVCGIENMDPMGIHTGDSITVSPIQTLTDREYQVMRSEAIDIVRAVGVETGGCNVQFAVDPKTGRRIVIEMNPRVSRSSALASKATGFPIAYVATKLALGYALSSIQNTITGSSTACFEPTLDYVAIKMPRWHFEKFPGSEDILLPQMQSVGEVLSIGDSLGEAFHKALRSLENKWPELHSLEAAIPLLKKAHSKRAFAIWDALALGMTVEEVQKYTDWSEWFLNEIKSYQLKNNLLQNAPLPQRSSRFEMIDTSSGEMRARTPFYYSSRTQLSSVSNKENYLPHEILYEKSLKLDTSKKGRVVILGSGPNRIGQGIEFDYCCVHASQSLQRLGYESIMVNCNPETVSTDPKSSDRLYLEPIEESCVREILKNELDGIENAYVLVQTGGQTPLKLAEKISSWGYKLLGSTWENIDRSEDRAQFAALLEKIGVQYPPFATVSSKEEMLREAKRIQFPILLRPSYVLGGRGMKICENEEELLNAFTEAKDVSEERPLFLDHFLNGAIEYDVDGICDGKKAWIAGVMEHVEEAGVHSGDSACVIPPFRMPPKKIDEIASIAKKIAIESGALGLFNIQMALVNNQIYVIEANPRASRTIPFLAKATRFPIVEWAMRVSLGESLDSVLKDAPIEGNYRLPNNSYAVKMPVFPFSKFKNFDPVLGPEMRSTGEVMGIDPNLGSAFAKAYLAAGYKLPQGGKILVSVRDEDKTQLIPILRLYQMMGFSFCATPGTADFLSRANLKAESVQKIKSDSKGDNLLDVIAEQKVGLIINTTGPSGSIRDAMSIRMLALRYKIPLLSSLSGAEMASLAIQSMRSLNMKPYALQGSL